MRKAPEILDPTRRRSEVLFEQKRRWTEIRDFEPYDRSARENLAEVLFEIYRDEQPVGTIQRSQLILLLIAESFPIPDLVSEYFKNLDYLLKGRPRRAVPGRIALGVGTGRCGSTSLTAMLATVDESCCTHENPPLVYRPPHDEQLRFHMDRFNLLREYFSLVFDASHWWLWVLDRLLESFPDAKIIGLYREREGCVRSFMRMKGTGWGSLNHWAQPGNGIWRAHFWDPTYPNYSLPANADERPDLVKVELIGRYVQEYNETLENIGQSLRERVTLVRMEEMSQPQTQEKIFDFIDVRGRVTQSMLNVGTVDDGAWTYKF